MISHDEKLFKFFYYWLIVSFVLICIMVGVGGATRLTNSGLSITEWELFSGIFPPFTIEKWEEYFLLYKKIPQYTIINNKMNIEEFKLIFYWEYFHRVMGRLIGLFFLIPLIYFFYIKKLNKRYLYLCLFILFMIIVQGVVGWYMVKSGLVNNTTVSHFRLALHLFLAFVIISSIFWLLLNVKKKTLTNFFVSKKYNYIFLFLIFLVFFQIIFGAFVSGLDAGKIYQTWPLMNNTFFPDDVSPNIQNLINFNDHSLIQFYHRCIAYLIFFYTIFVFYFIFKKKMKNLLNSFYIVFGFLILQIILGIVTLISDLNIYIALGHQICALLLTLSVINLHYKYIN